MKSARKFIAVAASLTMIMSTAGPAFAGSKMTKEETVYVVTDSAGQQNEVTVSDHLKNEEGADRIQDESNLKNIENVKGEETCEQGGGDAITWNANGKDIFYDGVTDDPVPVQLGISYFLDGEEVDGSEMNGASGNVRIVIKYRNTAKSDEGVTVPFIALTGFIAEDDCFSDIEVDHGKVIDDGDKKVIACFAAPGLDEALNIDRDLVDLDLNDTVTITGKARNFSVQDMMTVVTNSVFEDVDTEDLDDLDYDDQIKELEKGSKQLMDGSRKLYQGIDTLYSNMPKLKNGVGQLTEGAGKLDDGTASAKAGSAKLSSGAKQLSGVLTQQMSDAITSTGQLQVGSDAVLGGMKQIKAGLDGEGGAIDGLQKIDAGLDSASSGIDKVQQNLTAAKTASSDVENYLEALQAQFNKISAEDKAKLKAKGFDVSLIDKAGGKVAEQKAVESAITGVTSSAGLPRIQDGVDAAADGVNKEIGDDNSGLTYASKALGSYDPSASQQSTLIGVQTVINSGLTQLHDKLAKATGEDGDLTRGLKSLVSGAETLEAGEVQLAGGAAQLARGMEQLESKTGTLSGGVSRLDSGSLQLSKGMNTLYNEGIRKIVDLYNDDLKGNLESLEDVVDAGKSYKSFTRLPGDMSGNVKFIYKTEIYE